MRVNQPLGRIDVFSRTIGPTGYAYKRVETSPYLISYWIEWQTLPVGIIHLRSLQDDVTDISFFFYGNKRIPLNIDLDLLWNLPYETEETKELILGLANRITNISKSPKFGIDYELSRQYDLLSGELLKYLHSIAKNAFNHYLGEYLEKLRIDFEIPVQEDTPLSSQVERPVSNAEAINNLNLLQPTEGVTSRIPLYQEIDPQLIKIIIEWVEKDTLSAFSNLPQFLEHVNNNYGKYYSEKEFHRILVDAGKKGLLKKGENRRWKLANSEIKKLVS